MEHGVSVECKGDVQKIPRLNHKAPPRPDGASSNECGIGIERELLGRAGEIGDSC